MSNAARLELFEKWVSALRSGKYEQGKSRLRCGCKFCCLGVACDLYDPTRWDNADRWDRVGGVLSGKLKDLLGIDVDGELVSSVRFDADVIEVQFVKPLREVAA